MIKLIGARYLGDFQVELEFSDGAIADFDGRTLLQRSGSLLDPLRTEAYFSRCFIDVGALCWPNGPELSPTRLRESIRAVDVA